MNEYRLMNEYHCPAGCWRNDPYGYGIDECCTCCTRDGEYIIPRDED